MPKSKEAKDNTATAVKLPLRLFIILQPSYEIKSQPPNIPVFLLHNLWLEKTWSWRSHNRADFFKFEDSSIAQCQLSLNSKKLI
jgi:hypothetical protein